MKYFSIGEYNMCVDAHLDSLEKTLNQCLVKEDEKRLKRQIRNIKKQRDKWNKSKATHVHALSFPRVR